MKNPLFIKLSKNISRALVIRNVKLNFVAQAFFTHATWKFFFPRQPTQTISWLVCSHLSFTAGSFPVCQEREGWSLGKYKGASRENSGYNLGDKLGSPRYSQEIFRCFMHVWIGLHNPETYLSPVEALLETLFPFSSPESASACLSPVDRIAFNVFFVPDSRSAATGTDLAKGNIAQGIAGHLGFCHRKHLISYCLHLKPLP